MAVNYRRLTVSCDNSIHCGYRVSVSLGRLDEDRVTLVDPNDFGKVCSEVEWVSVSCWEPYRPKENIGVSRWGTYECLSVVLGNLT